MNQNIQSLLPFSAAINLFDVFRISFVGPVRKMLVTLVSSEQYPWPIDHGIKARCVDDLLHVVLHPGGLNSSTAGGC